MHRFIPFDEVYMNVYWFDLYKQTWSSWTLLNDNTSVIVLSWVYWCLCQMPKLESYVCYCANQVYVKSLLDMKKLDPAIDDFLHRCQESPFSRRLDLWSFLGQPSNQLKWFGCSVVAWLYITWDYCARCDFCYFSCLGKTCNCHQSWCFCYLSVFYLIMFTILPECQYTMTYEFYFMHWLNDARLVSWKQWVSLNNDLHLPLSS